MNGMLIFPKFVEGVPLQGWALVVSVSSYRLVM